MPELTVGTWNALNTPGNEQMHEAREVVKRMDADILYLGETTILGEEQSERYAVFKDSMGELGYANNLLSDYYPGEWDRPNQHTMSMWSRREGTADGITRHEFGNRYGMEFVDAETELRVVGYHPDDNSSRVRVLSAAALVLHLTGEERVGQSLEEVADDMLAGDVPEITVPTVVEGDFNDAGRRRTMQLANLMLRHVRVEHYKPDASKWEKLLSQAVRLSDMGDGKTMGILGRAGLKDADLRHRSTMGLGLIPLGQIDHIMGAHVALEDFKRHDNFVSDHSPITAKVKL